VPVATQARVAFAGEPGAFAEDAVLAYFGDVPRIGLGGFREVFAAVASGGGAAIAGAPDEVGFGVVPIENLVNGTVRENYDLLLEHDLRIVGEAVVPVRLCLAALPGERLETIERVYSHIQALGQAEAFLRTRPWTLLTTYNTAGAGKIIAERDERAAAAVLSPRAAGLFGLEILADGIQSVPDNRTRFLVLARPRSHPPGAPAPHRGAATDGPFRTTLVFRVRNEPGALLRVLQVFADRGLNLTSLESRPTRERAWEYDFWADLDADLGSGEPTADEALEALAVVTTMLRLLGSYPKAPSA
jgi:prephenate dehydratase